FGREGREGLARRGKPRRRSLREGRVSGGGFLADSTEGREILRRAPPEGRLLRRERRGGRIQGGRPLGRLRRRGRGVQEGPFRQGDRSEVDLGDRRARRRRLHGRRPRDGEFRRRFAQAGEARRRGRDERVLQEGLAVAGPGRRIELLRGELRKGRPLGHRVRRIQPVRRGVPRQ